MGIFLQPQKGRQHLYIAKDLPFHNHDKINISAFILNVKFTHWIVSNHYTYAAPPFHRALHHAGKRKVFSVKGELCLSEVSLRAAENIEHSQEEVMLRVMLLGTFGETKVPCSLRTVV